MHGAVGAAERRDRHDVHHHATLPGLRRHGLRGRVSRRLPECPYQAVFEEEATPAVFKDDVKLNYAVAKTPADFKVAEHEEMPHPTAEQVEANKQKYAG